LIANLAWYLLPSSPGRGGADGIGVWLRRSCPARRGFERSAILAELKAQQYHITRAAEALGLERSHLYKKCQQLGIDLQSLRKQG